MMRVLTLTNSQYQIISIRDKALVFDDSSSQAPARAGRTSWQQQSERAHHKIALALAVFGLMAPDFASATSIKAQGMAGVGIALPQDALAAATNPAGMVWVGDRLDFGLTWFRPQRVATISGNAVPGADGTYDGNNRQNFFIPEFSYNKMIKPNMSLGVSVYGNGMNTDYKNNPYGGFGATGNAGADMAQLFISPTFSMKLNESNSIGVALNLVYERFAVKGISPLMRISSAPANVTDRGHDSSTGWGLHLGWTGQLTPDLTVGVTYQSKIKMSKLGKYKGLVAEQGSFDGPENYGIGFAYKATPKWTIAGDVQQINYSDVRALANPLLAGGLLGQDNGSGFGWRDITVYKLGVAYEYSKDLTLRVGYSTTKQPIRASETLLNILIPNVVENHLTLGATWTLADKSELSVMYEHGFNKHVNGSGSIPPGPPPGFGGGNSNIKMHLNSIGIAYGWKM